MTAPASPADLVATVRRALGEATAGPWRWWTSNSFRRLSSDATHKDGDVLHAAVHRDGCPDIVGSEADKELIVLLRNNAAELCDRLEAAEGRVKECEAEHPMEPWASELAARAEAAEARVKALEAIVRGKTMHDAYAQATADIVAWLYSHAEGYYDAGARCNARWEAEQISEGAHLKGKGDGDG